MRILMVIGQFRPLIGGAERQCELLARALTARGHTVSVLTVRPERGVPLHETMEEVAIERIPYPIVMIGGRRFGCGFLALPVLWWRAWRMLYTRDVVMAHQALWPAFAACIAARWRGKPIIVKLGNSGERFDLDVLRQSHWYGAFARRFLLRYATRFVATSRAVRDDLRTAGVAEGRIAGIPNGVVLPEGTPSRSDTEGLRAVFVGTLTPKKNVAVLIDAIAQLTPTERTRVVLTLIGDGPERVVLERHVHARGITDRVRFHGMVNDATSVYVGADAFVLPSKAEGLSNAALEAMAHGCAMLLSDAGGNPDLVPDAKGSASQPFRRGTTGILVDPGSPHTITAAFRWFLAHPDERRQMGERARTLVSERYAIDCVTAAYETLLQVVTRPRVVHILTFLDEQTGGMERQALQLARDFHQRGYACSFITCAHVDRMRRGALPLVGTIDGIRVYRIPFIRGWWRWNAVCYGIVSGILLLVLQRRYDLIHAHQLQTSGLVASIVRRLLPSKRLIVKDAAGGATGDVTELRRLLGGRLIPMLSQHVDRFIAVSHEVAEELVSIGCTSVTHIPNGVDGARFRPPDAAARTRARFTILGSEASTRTCCVLTVGRLHPQKNIPVLIDAIAMLAPTYVLIIVGDGSERRALERYAHARGVRHRVCFIGAVTDVRPYYYAADVFVIPSRSEGLPNVVLEAMACGLPVVGSDIPPVRAIVQDAHEGVLVHPDDAVGFAAAIRRMTGDREHGRALGERARERILAEFSVDTAAERYATLYATLMTR